MPHLIQCGSCATPFEAVRSDARFCSRRCRDQARRRPAGRPFTSAVKAPEASETAPFAAAVTACLADLPSGLRRRGPALLAQALAGRLDRAGSRDTAALARELRATLAELRALAAAEPPQGGDVIDAILARRRIGPPTGP